MKILFVSANPTGSARLRTDQELRDIKQRLRGSPIELMTCGATRPNDLRTALLDADPDIVHFSGHGNEYQELLFEDEHGEQKPVPKEALVGLFAAFEDKIRVVVLNACASEAQAEAITQHID